MADAISFTMTDAQRLAGEIRARRPDLQVENHRDYGFAVDVLNPATQRVAIACQPQRDDIGQPGIWKSADAAIAEVA